MRTIRNVVVLFILLFFLTDAGHIYAVDSLFSVDGCDDITKPCATKGDGVNAIVPLNNIDALFAEAAAKLFGPENIITRLFGSLKPHDDSYRAGSDTLTSFGNQIQNATDFELNPAVLQSLEQHDESSKPTSMTSRECVYDQDGNLVADIVSNSTIVTQDVPWIRPAAEGARRISSFTTGYVQESQDFRLPNITIQQSAALKCSRSLEVPGEAKTLNKTVSQFANTYGTGGSGVGTFLYNLINNLIKLFADEDATNPDISAHIIGTGQNPYTGHAAALSAGCITNSDLADVSYATDEQKQQLCASGGFINSMYRPDTIDATYKSNLNAKDATQQWDQTITNEVVQAPVSNAFAARVEAAGNYMNCTLMPAEYQSTALPNGECNKNWSKPTKSGAEDVCSTADEYKIPCCMLMGIMKQETDFGKLQSTSACGAHPEFQCCYQGFGCGPANILCSQYSLFAGTDKPDLCSMDGSAVLLARAMRLKLCIAAGECTSHDWTTWGTAAMKPQYDVPMDISTIESYTATGYFYGMAKGCVPDACTQYILGPGKSYCDSVKNYCTTARAPGYADGQPLPNKTSPEFCSACSDTYVKNKLPPLSCP